MTQTVTLISVLLAPSCLYRTFLDVSVRLLNLFISPGSDKTREDPAVVQRHVHFVNIYKLITKITETNILLTKRTWRGGGGWRFIMVVGNLTCIIGLVTQNWSDPWGDFYKRKELRSSLWLSGTLKTLFPKLVLKPLLLTRYPIFTLYYVMGFTPHVRRSPCTLSKFTMCLNIP